MAKAMVKCFYCGQQFDRNSEPFVKPQANRYAHTACHEKHLSSMSQEERDYDALVAYIKQLFGGKVNIRAYKQIKEFKDTYNYSYSGMLKTLIWWYELRHNDIDKANGGIGIIPYVYQDAYKYYQDLYLASVVNEAKDIDTYTGRVREFMIEAPRADRPAVKLFKFREEKEVE